jgi:hypothetical protein
MSSCCPTCPSVPVRCQCFRTGPPDPRQPPFGPGTSPVSGQLCGTTGGGASHGVPVSCLRLPAFASRVILSRQGVGPSSRSAYRTRSVRTLTGFPRSTRTSYDRVGCLLYPEGSGAHPTGTNSPVGACRSSTASPCTPLERPISKVRFNETSTEVHAIHPSGLALTCSPRMERGPSGLNPELRTPPLPAAHVRAGTGH